MQRREFLSLGAAAGVPAIAGTRLSPNSCIRIAVAGDQVRSREHVRTYQALADQNVEIAAVADTEAEFLRVLEDASIDAVSLAAPHGRFRAGAMRACRAGKDVFVDSPGVCGIHEISELIDVARTHGRIVQHGNSHRSCPVLTRAVDRLRRGAIGHVYVARATGGACELDLVRWALDLDFRAGRVAAMGGRGTVLYECPGRDLLVTLERSSAGNVLFIGTGGSITLPSRPASELPHFENFIRAVRSRNPADLNAPPEQLYASASLAAACVPAKSASAPSRLDTEPRA